MNTMYSVVQYDNGFTEILPSKRVKKRIGYAVAKNCQVKVLYENEAESVCKSFLEREQNTSIRGKRKEQQEEVDKNKEEKIEDKSKGGKKPKKYNKKIRVIQDIVINLGHGNACSSLHISPEIKSINTPSKDHQSVSLSTIQFENPDNNLIYDVPVLTCVDQNEGQLISSTSPRNACSSLHISPEIKSLSTSSKDHSSVSLSTIQFESPVNNLICDAPVLTNVDQNEGQLISSTSPNNEDNSLICDFPDIDILSQTSSNAFSEDQLFSFSPRYLEIDGGKIPKSFAMFNDQSSSTITTLNNAACSLNSNSPVSNNLDLNEEIQKALDVLNEDQLVVSEKIKRKAAQKKHCCFYCQKQLFKIYRHYIDVHKIEKDVKDITSLPKKSSHRRMLLDKLRKKGDHLFNTRVRNESQDLIVCRETIESKKTKRERDVPCPNCLGYYSKLSVRHHIEKCMPFKDKKIKRRNIQAQCRRFENSIHNKACKVLREDIFPVLNEDDVTNTIRYDELVITYANYLCRKYTAPHHAQQIRSNMRSMGRLILAVKEINPQIKNLADVFEPSSVDLIIQGIDKVAILDKTSNLYKSPATAMLLATELKKLCKLMEMECIKNGDKQGKQKMEDLYLLFNLEFQVTVNKKGVETQKINHRRRKTNLPKTDQIARFRIYLETKIEHYTSMLEKKYSLKNWTHLAEYTLTHLAIFNRKRPGETQRLLIEDFEHYEVVENEDLSKDSDNLSVEQIKKWARIRFTGKLGKNTALLIHRELGFKAIDLILKYRLQAGVNSLNRFVFGEPSQYHKQRTFQACTLIRKFSLESGIENPELLRTRLLRQHLATETARSRVDPRLEGRVSDFMSHKRQIHEDYYVLTQKTDDITKVSTLLEEFSSVKEVMENPIKSQLPKSLSVRITPIPRPSKSAAGQSVMFDRDNVLYEEEMTNNCSDTDYVADEEDISEVELSYVMGKTQKRRQWSSDEKEKARTYFYDEIYKGANVSTKRVNLFFKINQDTYKYRTPHLIKQWIECERKKVMAADNGEPVQRLRWSTPEKELLHHSTEEHSLNGTIPSISECEQIIQDNKNVLKERTPQTVKAFIYNAMRKCRSF